jgi:hypothetical protein
MAIVTYYRHYEWVCPRCDWHRPVVQVNTKSTGIGRLSSLDQEVIIDHITDCHSTGYYAEFTRKPHELAATWSVR